MVASRLRRWVRRRHKIIFRRRWRDPTIDYFLHSPIVPEFSRSLIPIFILTSWLQYFAVPNIDLTGANFLINLPPFLRSQHLQLSLQLLFLFKSLTSMILFRFHLIIKLSGHSRNNNKYTEPLLIIDMMIVHENTQYNCHYFTSCRY
jgi:hypothetical protein